MLYEYVDNLCVNIQEITVYCHQILDILWNYQTIKMVKKNTLLVTFHAYPIRSNCVIDFINNISAV